MKKLVSLLLLSTLTISMLSGCSSSKKEEITSNNEVNSEIDSENTEENTDLSGKITIIGSTTVQPLAEDVALGFQEKNTGVTVEVQGIGSSAGIKSVIDNTADIGASSRDLKDAEKEANLTEHIVAKDGIAIVTNPSNPVKNLSLEELVAIYTGNIKNWSEVGGNDAPIIVVTRESGSGTRDAFNEILGLDEIVETALVGDGNGSVKANLASKENAIGYLSFGILDESVNPISIDNVEISKDTIVSGEYKIQRPLIMITNDSVTDVANEYINYILSDEGQEIVSNHYIPVK